MHKEKETKAGTKPSLDIGKSLSVAVLLLLVGGVGYGLYLGQQAMQVTDTTVVPLKVSNKKLPALPTLQVNQNHQRQGPVVQGDTNDLGRQNPFVQP